MKDDEFDALLRDAAETYNVPPEPPREAMWAAIAGARSAAAVTPLATRRASRWIAAAAGIAAVLMAGIVIGRASRGPVGALTTVAPTSTAVVAPTTAPGADSVEESLPSAPGNDVVPGASTAAPSAGRAIAPRRLAAGGTRRSTATDRATATDLSNDGMAYRLAVVEHLTRTEVLLTSFRAQDRSSDAARVDAQFAALSRDLLGTTRLLLATRRGEDPAITRLLQDLEYVLMQLSQYANDGRRVDRDAIDQSIDRRNVIPKLRATIPAGVSASAGT